MSTTCHGFFQASIRGPASPVGGRDRSPIEREYFASVAAKAAERRSQAGVFARLIGAPLRSSPSRRVRELYQRNSPAAQESVSLWCEVDADPRPARR
jgi:hypothetical protein